jgi:hemerythrin
MKYFKWTEKLEVGVEELDKQHKDIFRAASEMLDAMSKGKGVSKCYSLCMFLEKYIYDHFSLEELYMDKYEYANREAHKKEHEDFRLKFAVFKKQFDEEGASVHLVIKSMGWIHEWLTDHILAEDVKLVEFLKPLLGGEKP